MTSIIGSSLPEDFQPKQFSTRIHGSVGSGQTLLQNRYLFDGEKVFYSDNNFWSISTTNPSLLVRLHSFQWLGDLASVGTIEAKSLSHKMIKSWLTQFGSGKGVGWAPEIVGRRLTWLVRNQWLYLAANDQAFDQEITASIQLQYKYLRLFLNSIKEPILRVEALMGLIHAGYFLKRKEKEIDSLFQKLQKEIAAQLSDDGETRNRNPHELLIYGIIFCWVIELADEMESVLPVEIEKLSNKVGKSLSVICHYNGKLARFHGGRDAPAHLVRQTISFLTRKDNSVSGKGFGYRKLQQGSTSLIFDVAPPPTKNSDAVIPLQNSFELTSNFTPLCVNVGFEEKLEKNIEYQTQFLNSHSALKINEAVPLRNNSSAVLKEEEIGRKNYDELKREKGYQILISQHDAFVAEFGYYHQREIRMDELGHIILGTDTLIPNEMGSQNDATYTISFNLHPDVEPEWSEHSMTLQFVLPQGEVWDFQYEGRGTMVWNEGIFLDTINSKIIPTNLIQITGSTKGNRSRQRWKLEKVRIANTDRSLIASSIY